MWLWFLLTGLNIVLSFNSLILELKYSWDLHNILLRNGFFCCFHCDLQRRGTCWISRVTIGIIKKQSSAPEVNQTSRTHFGFANPNEKKKNPCGALIYLGCNSVSLKVRYFPTSSKTGLIQLFMVGVTVVRMVLWRSEVRGFRLHVKVPLTSYWSQHCSWRWAIAKWMGEHRNL